MKALSNLLKLKSSLLLVWKRKHIITTTRLREDREDIRRADNSTRKHQEFQGTNGVSSFHSIMQNHWKKTDRRNTANTLTVLTSTSHMTIVCSAKMQLFYFWRQEQGPWSSFYPLTGWCTLSTFIPRGVTRKPQQEILECHCWIRTIHQTMTIKYIYPPDNAEAELD